MSSVRRSVALVVAALPALVALGVASSSSAQEASPATSSSSSSSSSSTPLRRKREEPTEIEIIDLSDEPEPDAQAFAIGLQAGGGAIHTKLGDGIVPAADFAFTFDLGLGPGGARVPWTLEPYAAFALTRGSLSSTTNVVPDRWTEIGVHLVWRGEGSLDHHWVALGLGAVWTSYREDEPHPCSLLFDDTCAETIRKTKQLSFGPLADVGVGVYEWTARVARYGLSLRAPFELYGSHWGWGAIFAFYAQVGFRR